MQKISPFLWFAHEAEEAAELYTSVFKNSRITDVSRYGEAGQEVHGMKPGSVMTVDFELDGQHFSAINGGPQFKFNESISFVVDCATQEEVDYYWSKLGEGGDPSAQACGWLKDRYGLSWQIVPVALKKLLSGGDPQVSNAVMSALLSMKKIDIAALERARASSLGPR